MNPLERLRAGLSGFARSSPYGADGRAQVRGRLIYILPTGTGLLFSGVVLVMLLGSLNYQNNLGLLLTFLTASVGLVAMHHTWFNLLGLLVTARGGAPVFAGEEARFAVDVAEPGVRRRWDLRVRIGSGRSDAADMETGEEGRTIQIGRDTETRGTRRLGRLTLETRYPLGLFRAWCYVENPAEVVVYPRPARRSPLPVLTPTYRHSATGDRGVGADDFLGLRGYRPGDSPRQVDWKAFGRGRGLVVKQFGGDRADQVWLDWDHLPALDVETRLGMLCRQVLDASQAGQTFGLRLPGRLIPMGQGDTHKHRCLEALAGFGHG